MRTAHSSSHTEGSPHNPLQQAPPWSRPPAAGTPPGVGLEAPLQPDPLDFPLGCGPGDPPGLIPLNLPLGCGPGYPPPPPPRSISASPLGVGLETCKACWDTPPQDLLQGMLEYHLQCMLGYPLPHCGQTHTCENITFANYICKW